MDGLRTAFTVTPILSGIIVLSIASDPAQTQAGAVAQVLGGAMTGATLSAIVEYSLNKCEHSTETKIQIISANAGVGGAGALLAVLGRGTEYGPMISMGGAALLIAAGTGVFFGTR